MISMNRISAIVLMLISLTFIVSGAAAITLSIESGQVAAVGSTATLNMTLDSVPDGLSGYNITVMIEDPSIAVMESVSFPSWASLSSINPPLPSSSSPYKAIDLMKNVQAGATDVNMAAITVKGLQGGETHVTLHVNLMNGDSGTVYTPTIVDGLFSVALPNNTPPVANAQSVSTPEDTAKGITLTGSDGDGDTLTYSVVTAPSHGTLNGTAPALTYTPSLGYNGADSFTFKVNDGTVDSAPATVSITITGVNHAPVANAQSVTTSEDTAKAITLTGSDVDGDILTYSVVTGPSHGTLSGTAPNIIYTPSPNYHGADSFTFKVNDGTVDSAPATVTITVTSVNDAPLANGQSLTTPEDTAKGITLTGSDGDGDTLAYSVVTAPSHGTLNGTAPALTYTPSANYAGADSFTFKVNDGSLDSVPATVSITVTPVNDAPVANGQSVTTLEDTPKGITLTVSDVDGDPLTYSLVTGPFHGTLSGSATSLTYTPSANYTGADSFTFKVNDGTVDSAPATVTITVTPVNDAPVANGQSVTTLEDTPKGITLTGSDVDGDTLTYSIVADPSHGILSGTAPAITYTPTTGYYGADSFTFKVNDGTIDSTIATVAITVTPAGGSGLNLTSPNGGEVWRQGTTQTITWTYYGIAGSTVKIEILRSDAPLATLSSSTSIGTGGSGSFNFSFPCYTPLGTDYKIRVTSNDFPEYTDTSDGPFAFASGITVITPNGGETWQPGSTQTLRWNYTGSPGTTVKIEAMRGEKVLAVITPATPIGSGGSGSFNLSFPYHTPLGSEYRIRITSTTYPACTDTSNASFSVVPNTSASITLVSPDGGENYLQGSTQTIQWHYTGDPGPSVKIEALRGDKVLATVASSYFIGSSGSGSYDLKFPYNTPLGSDYKIRVTSTSNPAWTDTSDAPFTISSAITVATPNGGETYQIGDILPMSWTYTDEPGSTVNIDVYKGSGILKTLKGIPIGSAGFGSYSVTIPSATPLGADYSIRVSSTTYPACTDTTDLTFAIG